MCIICALQKKLNNNNKNEEFWKQIATIQVEWPLTIRELIFTEIFDFSHFSLPILKQEGCSKMYLSFTIKKKIQSKTNIDAPSTALRRTKYFSRILSTLHTPVQRVAIKHTFVCQTPLNLRGRRLVSPRSLLFCRDAAFQKQHY